MVVGTIKKPYLIINNLFELFALTGSRLRATIVELSQYLIVQVGGSKRLGCHSGNQEVILNRKII